MPKVKPKIYLETSVPNILVDVRDPELQKVTQEFWKTLKDYQVYISQSVMQEIKVTPDLGRKRELIKIIQGFPVLDITSEAKDLIVAYMEVNLVLEPNIIDAYHVAIATAHQVDILVTWNLEHLAKQATRNKVKKINASLGYGNLLEILTPGELLS